MTKEQTHFITINQETYFKSLAKDLSSLSILGFFCWFNSNFIGGSYFVNFLILCMIFLYAAKIKRSGLKDASFYSVKIEKINQIKEILEENQNDKSN